MGLSTFLLSRPVRPEVQQFSAGYLGLSYTEPPSSPACSWSISATRLAIGCANNAPSTDRGPGTGVSSNSGATPPRYLHAGRHAIGGQHQGGHGSSVPQLGAGTLGGQHAFSIVSSRICLASADSALLPGGRLSLSPGPSPEGGGEKSKTPPKRGFT
jgi:hypothetical protein